MKRTALTQFEQCHFALPPVEITCCATFHLGEVSRQSLALGLFSFSCFLLSPVQKMYLTRLIRSTTNHAMFGVKCRQIVPLASLQLSLHLKASKG